MPPDALVAALPALGVATCAALLTVERADRASGFRGLAALVVSTVAPFATLILLSLGQVPWSAATALAYPVAVVVLSAFLVKEAWRWAECEARGMLALGIAAGYAMAALLVVGRLGAAAASGGGDLRALLDPAVALFAIGAFLFATWALVTLLARTVAPTSTSLDTT